MVYNWRRKCSLITAEKLTNSFKWIEKIPFRLSSIFIQKKKKKKCWTSVSNGIELETFPDKVSIPFYNRSRSATKLTQILKMPWTMCYRMNLESLASTNLLKQLLFNAVVLKVITFFCQQFQGQQDRSRRYQCIWSFDIFFYFEIFATLNIKNFCKLIYAVTSPIRDFPD